MALDPHQAATANAPKHLSHDEIEAIKARHRLEEVISGYVQLHKAGSVLKAH
jgi:hypothetical protein